MPGKSRQTSATVATRATSPDDIASKAARRKSLLCGAALVVMVFVTYTPVLTAGFIWDDEENVVTNGTLRTLDGLRQMWLVPHSIQQYYPPDVYELLARISHVGAIAAGLSLGERRLACRGRIIGVAPVLRLQVPGHGWRPYCSPFTP